MQAVLGRAWSNIPWLAVRKLRMLHDLKYINGLDRRIERIPCGIVPLRNGTNFMRQTAYLKALFCMQRLDWRPKIR